MHSLIDSSKIKITGFERVNVFNGNVTRFSSTNVDVMQSYYTTFPVNIDLQIDQKRVTINVNINHATVEWIDVAIYLVDIFPHGSAILEVRKCIAEQLIGL